MTYLKEIKNNVIELYKKGLSIDKISKKIGAPPQTISRWLKENGLTRSPKEALD